MKKGILFLIIVSVAATANAQSLKDLLYSGKLKMDSNSVVRKTDDLSSKIDTSTKKVEPEKAKSAMVATEISAGKSTPDSTASGIPVKENNTAATTATTKNNTQVWKQFMDSLVSTLKTDVLSSKKIKKDTYYLYVDYEIGIDGQVNVTNVVANPENTFLQDQVKERLIQTAPQLTPVLDSTNKPRKMKRKYNFNITKE